MTIGSPTVMVEQLERLLAVGARSWVRLQVIRFATPRVVLTDSFSVLTFADSVDTDVAYFTGTKGQVVRREGETEVRTTRAGFDQLSSVALPPPDSAELISALLEHATG